MAGLVSNFLIAVSWLQWIGFIWAVGRENLWSNDSFLLHLTIHPWGNQLIVLGSWYLSLIFVFISNPPKPWAASFFCMLFLWGLWQFFSQMTKLEPIWWMESSEADSHLTNRSAKLINFVMSWVNFLFWNLPCVGRAVLGRKSAAFSRAFVSPALAAIYRGVITAVYFPTPHLLTRVCEWVWESLKLHSGELRQQTASGFSIIRRAYFWHRIPILH